MSSKKIKANVKIADITIEQVETTKLNKRISAGNYTLIAMKDGNEFGNEFTISARTYDKVFKNNPKFKVKKNPQ